MNVTTTLNNPIFKFKIEVKEAKILIVALVDCDGVLSFATKTKKSKQFIANILKNEGIESLDTEFNGIKVPSLTPEKFLAKISKA